MTTYNVSLRAAGDPQGLSATLTLEGGRLELRTSRHEIGQWPLDEVDLEPTGTGYRMTAEGDTLILDFHDVGPFEAELTSLKVRRRRRRKGKERKGSGGSDTTSVAGRPEAVAELAPALREGSKSSEKRGSIGGRVLRGLDRGLAFAEDRYGALLPAWVFTRGMAAAVLVSTVLALLVPGLVSLVMFTVGALVVILGAIAYSDAMIASRWLPGRSTPAHALIGGVALILLGVGFALLAR